MLNIAIAGSAGRMGRILLETVVQAPDMRLSAALERPDSPYLGKDAGELIGAPCGINVTSDFTTALAGSHVLIDFTRPEGTLAHLAVCRAGRGDEIDQSFTTVPHAPCRDPKNWRSVDSLS